PSAIRSAPAQAIIAPLSVQSAGGGMISVVCAFAATSCNALRMAWLAATPPAATNARGALQDVAAKAQTTLIIPPPALCTDNGAMIAWAGAERMALGLTDTMEAPPRARWLLDANAKAPAGHANSRAGY
ncbi:MAG: hypothetical protein ACK47P_25480, partial [Bradyrhizobium sp.]